jgi:hypothetical protein
MRGRRVLEMFFLCLVLVLGSFGFAQADTILFPVIAVNQPNITTVVSVYNTDDSDYLHYIYRFKDSVVGHSPNYAGTCGKHEFTRNSASKDLVSFDASGIFNSGNAMFNDSDIYDGTFDLGVTGQKRAYLLVTHSDASGNPVDKGNPSWALGGEAYLMDIAYGAVWGYKAVNDDSGEDYSFKSIRDGGGVTNALDKFGTTLIPFSFLPPNEWKTKFFVTPIGDSMDTANLSADIRFSIDTRVVDRSGTSTSPTSAVNVVCTAAVDLSDLLGATALAAVENTGGWTYLYNKGDSDFDPSDNGVLVYKLDYVVEDSTYGGTNNNGYLLSTVDQ